MWGKETVFNKAGREQDKTGEKPCNTNRNGLNRSGKRRYSDAKLT